MLQQSEFVKNVRASVQSAQARATEKLGALEGEARKVIDGLVERGRGSLPQAKARVDELQKRALIFVDSTSREQASVVAGGLRKWAERLEKVAVRDDSTPDAGAQA